MLTGSRRRRRWSVVEKVAIVAGNRVGSNAMTIEIGGAIVQVGPGIDPAFLSEVIRLLKAAS